ncbi:dihydrodipicolinate reductase [Buchnera aphidicola (Cinara tujafilina)]|uniref:4-hydroxy-tetrahydrodipicolinate reductase n=1 Tax=Buchnera aphidicola (Cinara tujafilina) TaxID=261317 RepID=F7WZ37_9GAMM|nr:4-hydroxy-tetrahydrodipicolinate reductase [Buchnera aphidicola]AEH39687.1 dihydrodipicolinate reductase [Buchnera aphidicola (Cinara tujafilina)]
MNQEKTKIIISGAFGRMGKILIKETIKNQETSLIGAIINENSKKAKEQQSEIKKDFLNYFFLKILKNNHERNLLYDVLIDFTTPQNTINNLKYCIKNQKNIIIGTTGFNEQQLKTIKSAAKNIAILFSPNFSIGINLLYNITKYIASIIGKYVDIEIIEYHHRNKVDAPSGTALQIGKNISESMGWNFNKDTIFQRYGIVGPRKKNKIGYSVVRGGDIIGEHKILFADLGEQIEIIHKATNRSAFARGAIKAAIWIKNKKMDYLICQTYLKIFLLLKKIK